MLGWMEGKKEKRKNSWINSYIEVLIKGYKSG